MLRVDFEGAEACIAQMEGYINEMKANAEKINKLMTQTLGQSWEGDSYNKCQSIYAETYQNMLTQQVPTMVDDLNKYMKHCKEELKKADQSL